MIANRDRVYRFCVIFVMFPPLTVYFLANAVVYLLNKRGSKATKTAQCVRLKKIINRGIN